mgnify:CR=1 FL=1
MEEHERYDETIYCDDCREQMLENDEIDSIENAFMAGYEDAASEKI